MGHQPSREAPAAGSERRRGRETPTHDTARDSWNTETARLREPRRGNGHPRTCRHSPRGAGSSSSRGRAGESACWISYCRLVRPLAEVAAGTPILSEAHIVEWVPAVIANRFRPRPDYLLTVRGDSMDRTGLQDGDIVAVRKTNEARNGQVVVARFGDEVTLKRYWKLSERHVELRPESHNPGH